MRLSLWPQSLFGRLIASSIVALLLAQVVSIVLVAREREHFILQGTVREWSRRIAEVTAMLQSLDESERPAMVARLSERRLRFEHRPPPDVILFRDGRVAAPDLGRTGPPVVEELGPPGAEGIGPPDARGESLGQSGSRVEGSGPPVTRGEGSGPSGEGRGPLGSRDRDRGPRGSRDEGRGQLGPDGDDEPGRHAGRAAPYEGGRGLAGRGTSPQLTVPFMLVGDFESAFEQQLRSTLGSGFEVHVAANTDPSKKAIPISGPLFSDSRDNGPEQYDATVKFPDGFSTVFRVTRLARGAPLPRGLFLNLAFLLVIMSIALFVVARSITRPLLELASAADSVGRNLRQPKIAERGARELRNAARAFNTMQDRLQRYLDSRSRVLAAMSHDLKTPLTRLRLQVEMLDDAAAQTRLSKQLDEMESMVHGALALFRGLDDNEAFTPLDMNEMLVTLQAEFAEMNAKVAIEGRATRTILGKPQALRRCLTNLIANAVKFGTQASVIVEDGAALVIRIRDDGPGIPESELERVFEPFYRLESSRNRDTGGTGLGLSIARDVVQAHGGSLVLANLPMHGLEATVTLPRA
jgi:signal transduction histidine kinase